MSKIYAIVGMLDDPEYGRIPLVSISHGTDKNVRDIWNSIEEQKEDIDDFQD